MRHSASSWTQLSTIAVGLGFANAAAGAEITSAYSTLAAEGCETLLNADPPPSQIAIWSELGAVRQVCSGYADHVVHIVSGDTVLGVGFVPEVEQDAVFPLEVFDIYSVPTRGAVEWRLRDDEPFAVILRWTIDRGAEPPDYAENGSVLVVYKLTRSTPSSCVMGLVDAKANAGANTLARKVADMDLVDSFACGVDRPDYFGVVGPTAAPRRLLN